ncbi:MAG: protein arginine N-methyltransferase [Wenzhouxiangellaceae bacterium]
MLNRNEITTMIQSGRVAEARQRCRDEVAQGCADAHTWLLLGACEQRMENPEAALEALQKAAQATNDTAALQQIADAMMKLREFEAAARVVARLDFSRPQSVLLQARCRWGLGEHAAALEQLRALSEIVPKWTMLAISHARMLINLDLPDEALEVVDRALSANSGELQLVRQKALLLVSLQGTGSACEWLADQPRRNPALEALFDALQFVEGREGPLPSHSGPQWEGFCHLFDAAAGTAWFGDNVALLRHALSCAPARGAVVECGVFHGRTASLLARWAPQRRVFGFDSFQGLPEAWSGHEPAGSYSTGGRLPEVPQNVELRAGWFDQTLPEFAAGLDQPIALLHVDCDLYTSAAQVLSALGPCLAPGTVVVFDEYTGYAGWRDHEHRAWREYLAQSGADAGLHSAQLVGQSAAFEITRVRA